MLISARQVKAARALLGWSQATLAGKAEVGLSTVADFEREARTPIRSNHRAICAALRDAGIVFTKGGVALREKR